MSRTSKEGIREAGIVAKDAPKADQNLYGVSIGRLDLLYTNPCTLINVSFGFNRNDASNG